MFTIEFVFQLKKSKKKTISNVFLRLAMTAAVRLCMEGRFQRNDSSSTLPTKKPMKDPIESILELTYLMNNTTEGENLNTIENLLNSLIKNPQSVLQEIDIHRLRAILYRDVVRPDRHKSGKNVVVVVVNFRQYFLFLCFLSFSSLSSLIFFFCLPFLSFRSLI